jgi:hypothetical protein
MQSGRSYLFEEKVEFHQLIRAGVVDHLGAGIIRAARYINAHLRPKIAKDKSYLCWEDHIREKHDGRLLMSVLDYLRWSLFVGPAIVSLIIGFGAAGWLMLTPPSSSYSASNPYPSHPYCCESLNALHLYTHPLSPSPNTAPSLWTVIWIIVTSFNSFNRISFHNSERRHNSSVGNPQYSGKYTTGSWSGAWLGSAAIADSAKTMTWCRRQRP